METKEELPKTPIIEEIEKFRKHYYALDFEIDRDAFSVPCEIGGQRISLGNLLTTSMNNYLISKGNYEYLKDDGSVKAFATATRNLSLAITQLTGANLIKESKSLLTKVEELERENEQLKETEFQLKAEIADLRTENKRLHNLVGDDNDYTSTLESPKE